MKRLFVILSLSFLILILAGDASAQVVLGPQPPAATGGVWWQGARYNTTYGVYNELDGFVTTRTTAGSFTYRSDTTFQIYVGGWQDGPFYWGPELSPGEGTIYFRQGAYTVINDTQGVIEFLLPDSYDLDYYGVTTNNFTARLNGLTVTYSRYGGGDFLMRGISPDGYGGGTMHVGLYDLGDGSEDGYVNSGDFNNSLGGAIQTRTHTFGEGGTPADFQNVDVTTAIRRDLFGEGLAERVMESGNYAGFILKSPDAQNQWVIYGKGMLPDPRVPDGIGGGPTLTITVVETVNATCGNCTIGPATTPALPAGAPADFNAQTAVSFTATGVTDFADISIAFASLPENPVFYKVVGGTWTQIYPTNETTCITNVTFDSSSKVLSFTIADNSDCDADPDLTEIEDPVVVGSGTTPTTPTTPTTATAPGSSNAGCFIDTVAK